MSFVSILFLGSIFFSSKDSFALNNIQPPHSPANLLNKHTHLPKIVFTYKKKYKVSFFYTNKEERKQKILFTYNNNKLANLNSVFTFNAK